MLRSTSRQISRDSPVSRAWINRNGPQSTDSVSTTKSGNSSAYDSNFMNHLIDNSIGSPQHKIKPLNDGRLRAHLLVKKRSLTPSRFSESKCEKFLDAIGAARDEAYFMSDVFSKFKGDTSYPSTTNRICTNWALLTSAALVAPKLDFFDGEDLKQEDAVIRDILSTLIVPSTNSDAPYLPNVFAEVKVPDGSAETSLDDEIFDGNAYNFAIVYSDGAIETIAHHMTAPQKPGIKPSYHTVSLGRWILNGDKEQFFLGTGAFRNIRDHAKLVREKAVADAIKGMEVWPLKDRESKLKEATAAAKRNVEKIMPVVPPPVSA
ncbi:MAG: hypothetical protein MMC33_007722 [Icmadophila ericetorum]|nr:hypothetical protein [Icmadophila ericetorum]